MKKLMALPVVLLSILLIVSTVACGSGSSSITYCDSYNACPTDKVGDGYCDEGCNTAECNYDNGDCSAIVDCESVCPDQYIGDGFCNSVCNNAACNYDGGDCAYSNPLPSGYCATYCPFSALGDGVCSAVCMNDACYHDGGDCIDTTSQCSTGCLFSSIGDGTCQSSCNNWNCNYDGGDCSHTPTHTTTTSLFQNGDDAEEYALRYIQNSATSYHGQQVLAEFFDNIYGGETTKLSDGSWSVCPKLPDWVVEQSTILKPIFKDGHWCDSIEGYHQCQWGVDWNCCWAAMCFIVHPDGTVQANNGNAIRLTAELQN